MAVNAHHSDTPDTPRDPRLDRLYAASAREEPPVTLDEAIRAAARREVLARPRPLRARFRAWRTPVSIAAVLVLSASLVMLMREEAADPFYHAPAPSAQPAEVATEASPAAPPQQTPPPAPSSSRPSLSPTPAPAMPERRFEGRERSDKPMQDDASRRAQSRSSGEPLPSASPEPGEERRPSLGARAARSQPKESTAAGETTSAPDVAGRAERDAANPSGNLHDKPLREGRTIAKSTEPGAGSADAASAVEATKAAEPPKAAASPPPRALSRQQAQSDQASAERKGNVPASQAPVWAGWERQAPEKWIERIEELRRIGLEAEAREMLEEFRKRFPHHPLPASLMR
jgi:hypothetical protein